MREGKHFLEKHGQGFNLKNEEQFEENVMKHYSLIIIASVEPGKPWSAVKTGTVGRTIPEKPYDNGL